MAKQPIPVKENILPSQTAFQISQGRLANFQNDLDSPIAPDNSNNLLLSTVTDASNATKLPITNTTKQLFDARRFPVFNPLKTENEYAYGQSNLDAAANGVLKGLGLVGTTIAGGFGMLGGLAISPFTGRLADIWDNKFMRSLDEINEKLDNEILPNYYTDAEKEAAWYSPTNWFKTNFLFDKLIKNAGFAVGAMFSGNIANTAILSVGKGLGTLAMEGAALAEASQAFKSFTPLLKNTARAFSQGRNFEAAQILEKQISSIADLTKKSSEIANIAKTTNAFADLGDSARRTAIALYSSAGEASFEALQTAKEYRNNLIEEFKNNNNGQEPTGADLQRINEFSESVGATSFLGNIALLSVTEGAQLPYLMGSSYKASQRVANDLGRKVDDIVLKEGKYVAKEAGKITKGRRVSSYLFDIKESGQEVGQYALQIGAQNYWDKAYQSQEGNVWVDGVLHGFLDEKEGAFYAKEGGESFALGGITGGLMQVKGKVKERSATKKNTQDFLNLLNNAPDFKKAFQDRLNSVNRGITLQTEQEQAIMNGDKLNALDLKSDMMHNYLSTRIKYGRYDMVMSDLAEARQMGSTEQGLADLKEQGLANKNDTVDSFTKRISEIQLTANNLNELYESLNLRYGGLVDQKGRRIYSQDVIDKMTYAATKIADYDKRISELNTFLTENGVNAQYALNNAPTGEDVIYKESIDKIKEQKSLKEDEIIQSFEDVVELGERRRKFLNEYNDIKENPIKYRESQEKELPTVKEGEEKPVLKLKTNKGEVEVELGTEYFIGRIIKKSDKGDDVYGSPKITILGENEDGTIQVKDSNGQIRNLKKNDIEALGLIKVSDAQNNKKLKFFMDHWNTLYEFNFGKGKKKQGRLEWSSKESQLLFTYLDDKGRIKSIEVTGDQFIPKEGYKQAMITPVGTLTPAQQKSLEEMAVEKDERIKKKREARLAVLSELFDEIINKQTAISKLISQKKSELDNIISDLNKTEEAIKNAEFDARYKKSLTFKSNSRKALEAAMRLSRMKEQLQQEIDELESQREELEFNASYVADLAQNIDELPTDSTDFFETLKEERDAVQDLIIDTGLKINALSGLIDKVDQAINSTINVLRDLVSDFQKKYPKVPMSFGQEWVDFLQNNPNFLKLKPAFKDDLKQLEDLIAQVEDFEITPNQEKLKEMKSQVEKLNTALKDAEKELSAKDTIVSKFEEIVEKEKKRKQEEERLRKDQALRDELLGSADPSLQTVPHSEEYEVASKKNDLQVVTSSKSTISDLPHHVRANEFGQNKKVIKKMAEKKIKAVMVTVKNEAQLGLAGLTSFLKGDSDIDPTKTIVMVMVEDVNGKPVPVDVNGERLDNPSVDNAIFQVMPDPKLTWSKEFGGDSMFRDAKKRPDVVKHYTEQYEKWVVDILANPSLVMHIIEASFGRPEYVETLDDKGNPKRDYTARTSAEDANLITEDDLASGPVIFIPTVNTHLEQGSTSFESPLGRPFLRLPNGYVPLDNRKFTRAEAENMFNAIYALAKDVFENGNAKSEKARRLYNWLKSVVYWGTPRNEKGHNSIFFAKDEIGDLMLYLSGKGAGFEFTPSSLLSNKQEMLALIEGMYNNINNNLLSDNMWNQPYEELILNNEGEIVETKEWSNYQTYLLSGKGRKPEALPLSTQIKPVSGNQVNRKGIYFTIKDTIDQWVAPAPKTKVTPKPAGQAQTGKVTLDGKTINTYTAPSGAKIKFTATAAAVDPKNEKALTVVKDKTVDDIIEKTTKQLGSKEKAIENIKNTIRQYIAFELKKQKQEEETEVTIDDDVEEAPSGLFKKTAKKEEPEPETVSSGLFKKTKKAPETIEDEEITSEDEEKISSQIEDDDEFFIARVRTQQQETEQVELENWEKVEQWLKENFPNLPVYRVKNALRATNGIELWGMLQDAAIYVTKDAETGTVYHEVFEAVWKMFTDPTEQKAVLSEFYGRKGSFIDRPTGREVKYSEATPQEAKEQLAEEFRDYVLNGKIPAKPTQGKPFILKLFADIYNFIKSFFTGEKAQTNTANLFEKIGKGYYKKHSPYAAQLSLAKEGIIDIDQAFVRNDAEFRVKGIAANVVNDIIQHMTFITLRDIVVDNKSLFNIIPTNREALYNKLKDNVQKSILLSKKAAEKDLVEKKISKEEASDRIKRTLSLWKAVETQWDSIKAKHEDYLKIYNIEFDENDEIQVRDEDKIKESDYVDATKVDNFKKANSAVKLLLSTIPVVNNEGKPILSSINGVTLLPTSKAFMAVMNKVHSSKNIDEMMNRIKEMGEEDSNYKVLYSRLMLGASSISQITGKHNLQLLASFWRTFKKQNPDVKNVYIFDNGLVEVGDSNFGTATRQILNEYNNNIIEATKTSKVYFEYDPTKRAYVGKPDGIKNVKLTNLSSRISFLKSLGITFSLSEITTLFNSSSEKKRSFEDATDGIRKSIEKRARIATIGGKVLDIEGRLKALAEIRAIIDNPEFDSTFFNASGERTQTFIGTNPLSDLYDNISEAKNLNELNNSNFRYILTDTFSRGSLILKKMFTPSGTRIKGSEGLLKPAWADGTINTQKGKRKQSSKLTFKERLIQEINMNIKGYYYNLVPGDANLEWMVYMDNHISASRLLSGMGDVYDIFKDYLESEILLSRENREIVEDKKKERKSTDLRFFKGILGKELHDKIVKDKRNFNEIYATYGKEINSALDKFFKEEAGKLKASLSQYDIIKTSEEGDLYLENINLQEKELTNEALDRNLMMLSINYAINNIELHKLLYSDPYQYSDELKRIKNANSPRQAVVNSSTEFNKALNNVWNEGYKGTVGETDFTRDHLRTVTLSDINATNELKDYGVFEETDGAGIISFKGYRNFRIRAGEWNDNEEQQYQYDVKLQELVNSGASEKEIKDFLAKNPKVKSALVSLKPIVFGNRFDSKSKTNNIVMDKFALHALSFSVLYELNPNSNAMKLLKKMQREDIDYAVFASGRKVGAGVKNSPYIKGGEFNNLPYNGVVNIPFSIISIQTDVPSKLKNEVTRGSQITKLATLDFMQAGVPIDFLPKEKFDKRFKEWNDLSSDEKKDKSPLYKEIKRNQELLENMIINGYNNLLDRMGIKDVDGEFIVDDISKTATTLREEILKREVNDNIANALAGFLAGDVVLEATPAYQQIRNILYSIADKEVISPKMNGAQRVQVPSTFFEEVRPTSKDGIFQSDVLEFYKDEDGKRVCEVMISRWFESEMSDAELLNYLNNTEEGQKILSGVAFRIPTQKQNSIDVFKVKQFLPSQFGDAVVIPSALVKKSGSDFDIDKLSMYFKSVYRDAKNKVKLVPFYGFSNKAIGKFRDLVRQINEEKISDAEKKILSQTKLRNLFGDISLGLSSEKVINKWIPIFKEWFKDDLVDGKLPVEVIEEVFITRLERLNKKIEKITIEDLQEAAIEEQAHRLYKQSLQNEYIDSLEKLTSHPLNFNRLVIPNSADQLKDLSAKVVKKSGQETFDYSSVKNMMSRDFMSKLRHAFVNGRYAIGIAAVNQTNHSLNQRQPIYIDMNKWEKLSMEDFAWLSGFTFDANNIDIKFKNYNKVEVDGVLRPSLSGITNSDGDYISDLLGQFIDGYVDISKGPWIMELGAVPNVAPVWLFLTKLGVPIEDIAYFMNQPIIKDYLRKIENAGYSWLFIQDFMEDVATSDKYKVSSDQVSKIETIPSADDLYNMLGKEQFSDKERAQQQLILTEFAKYAKMANHLFLVTQGTNYDTAAFNDPFLIFKKNEQYKNAQNSIISSVDELTNNSFIGQLKITMTDIREAYSTLLKSDHPNIREVIEKILIRFIDMPDRDFVKVAQKVVSDLFDYAVQVDTNVNTSLQKTLIDDRNSVSEVMDFVKQVKSNPKHPLFKNHVIELIKPHFADKPNGVNNLKIKNKDNKVYDQNQLIYSFEELKSFLRGTPLYGKLIRVAVLQSGLSNSPISFTSMLPYEDFRQVYNNTLSKLETFDFLQDFNKLNIFERRNWHNSDIVPHRRAMWKKNKAGEWRYNQNMNFHYQKGIQKAIDNNKIPQLVKLNDRSREADNDFIVYSWEVGSKHEKKTKREQGDFSYIKKGLFQKVYKGNEPLTLSFTTETGITITDYIYKLINAWGESSSSQGNYHSANEFYTSPRKSIIDNNMMKVDNELADATIVTYLYPEVGNMYPKENKVEFKTTPNVEVVSRYSVADVKANPNKIYVFGDNTQRKGTGGQAQIRNTPNAMGIATKIAPSNEASAFMTDKDLTKNKSVIDGDIAKIKATNKPLVFPKDGFGTGLAKLKEKAPQTYAYLKQRLLYEFDFNNDTGKLTNEDPLTKC